MQLSDFDFDLPSELIAQNPVVPRDSSKLFVVNKSSDEISHHNFKDLSDLLDENTVLVFNKTKVIPARLFGAIDGFDVEVFLHRKISKDTWECLVKPGKRFSEGVYITFDSVFNQHLQGIVVAVNSDGSRKIKFNFADEEFDNIIQEIGNTPLPPYIDSSSATDEQYQTIYSEVEGSVAAPTAGLHFTKNLIRKLEQKGVQMEYVTLHIGRGTFEPVRTDDIESHNMHTEYYEIAHDTSQRLNAAKKEGKKIICVGTTSVRVLETICVGKKLVTSTGETDIFIYPGYEFKFVDGMITNFHLPKSTLLMLVSAMIGRERMLNIYNEAIKLKYRFYSFGDAMLIV